MTGCAQIGQLRRDAAAGCGHVDGGRLVGAFTYWYPITVPPVPGGLAPPVSLDYDSQALDGETSSTNDQASWGGPGLGLRAGGDGAAHQTASGEVASASPPMAGPSARPAVAIRPNTEM